MASTTPTAASLPAIAREVTRRPAGGILYALPNVYGLDRLSGVPGLTTYSSFAVYFGVAAMLLALVGGWRARRLAPARALAIVAGLALMARFGVPPMTWLFHSVWPCKL